MVMHGRGFHMRHSAFKGSGSSLPLTGLLGAWYIKDYSASPRPNIKNAAAATSSASAQLLTLTRRAFANGNYWGGSGLTVTDAFATGSDGSASSASRIQAAGGAGWTLRDPAWMTVPAGTYSVECDVRYRGTGGTSAQFKIGNAFGGTNYSAAKTGTTSWARFQYDVVMASSGALAVAITSPDGTSSADFEVDNFECYPTGGMQGPMVKDGRVYFGKNYYDTQPTVASGAMNFDGTGYQGFAQFAAPTTYSAFSFMACVSKTTFNTVTQPIFTALNNTSLLVGDVGNIPNVYLGGTQPTASAMPTSFGASLNNYRIFGVRYDGTNTIVMIDGVEVAKSTNALTATALADFCFGFQSSNNFSFKGKIAAWLLWSRSLSLSEWNAAASDTRTKAVAGGITLPTTTRWIMTEGDSITAKNPNGYANTYSMPNYNSATMGYNPAIIGSAIVDLENRFAADSAIFAQMTGTKIMTFYLGANDFQTFTTNGQRDTWLARVFVYLDSIRALGVKVIYCTQTPANVGTYPNVNPSRNYLNPIIRGTTIGLHFDAIADFAADATVGTDAAGENATYYAGPHPTDLCDSILAPIWYAAANSFAGT